MQFADNTTAISAHIPEMDLGPLSWVFGELRKSFDAANKGLKRFIREAGVQQNAELTSVDVTHLRAAKSHVHQIIGVLDVLGLREVGRVVKSMESLLQRCAVKPHLMTEHTFSQVEYASFAVVEYLECLLAGKPTSAIELFVQYRDMSLLAGAERVHPADLWRVDSFVWLNPSMPASPQPLTYSPSVRSVIDASLLKVMQSGDSSAALTLSQLSLGLSETQTNGKATVFWRLCAAFFEAVAKRVLPLDLYVKRSALGIVIHYNNLQHGDWVFSDKFMHDMLFLCEQAVSRTSVECPLLACVKATWRLQDDAAVNYETKRFGYIDPVVLALSKKRIVAAKELWTDLAGGDIHKIRSTVEQFKLVTDSLIKVYPSSTPLAQALNRSIDAVALVKMPPKPELALEVATALLYLEAIFEQWV